MATNYRYDKNGNLTAVNDAYAFFHGGIYGDGQKYLQSLPEDVQQYLLEFNQAKQQYEQQYQLQREAFDLNKQNLVFNQNLATRQQEFAENSWKNNITNSARQMATLGINPASSGGAISGPTMSGGSQVAGVNSGSVSGRSVQRFNNKATKIQLLSTLLQHAKDKKALDISQQEADTRRISALADAGLKSQEFRNNEEAYVAFASLGLSYPVVRALENVDLSTVGLTALFKIASVVLDGDEPTNGESGIIVDIAKALDKLPKSVQDSFDSYVMDNSDSKALMSVTLSDVLKVVQSLDSDSSRTDIAVKFSKYL